LDKAGAYALQGDGRRFVRRVIGSESNVIGLPVEETLALLAEAAAGAVAREAGRPGRGAG
jgi:predicted house-cleaning NTP pyrophosphatase (Maf/HAM1 superfamily)